MSDDQNTSASISVDDLGEQRPTVELAEEARQAAIARGEWPGNAPAATDSASTVTTDQTAPVETAEANAAASSVDELSERFDLLDRFESRHYPDGVTIRSTGELPSQSPVSYPANSDPVPDSHHGLLDAIEAYFTTALRSSRTDGHKLIARLRAQLPQS